MTKQITDALQLLAYPEKVEILQKFFKTGKGEYAEGDQFIGVTVPDQRKVAKEFWNKTPISDLQKLLSSKIHEYRHTALLILVIQYEKTKEQKEKEQIVDFYLKNKKYINHWDLVDSSCYKILGRHCFETQNEKPLIKLSAEDSLWSKRIAIVSTMWYVKKGNYQLMKALVLKNLNHPHDLMHKANGWLLREMGNKNEQELLGFLKKNYKTMSRTSLRYAIEKIDEPLRQDFLKGHV